MLEEKQINTPILFVIFNRPDTTQKVFDEIKKVKPQRLFVAADGPRNDNEVIVCDQARSIIKQIDWDCEVKTLFQEKNLGCKIGVSTAINWFFDNVEEGIILEDDCLPDTSFFYYCQELLEEYRDNKQIMHISGSSFVKSEDKYSYFFSRYPLIWGWATWKRAWKHYDLKMNNFPMFIKNNKISNIFSDRIIKMYWLYIFLDTFNNKINTWDYQWTFSVWANNGISILPNTNLISNLGFDDRATHTKSTEHKLSKLMLEPIENIQKPEKIIINDDLDKKIFEIISNLQLSLNLKKIKFIIKRVIRTSSMLFLYRILFK